MIRKTLLLLALVAGLGLAPRCALAQDEAPRRQRLSEEQQQEYQDILEAQQEAGQAIEGAEKDYGKGAKLYKKLCEKVDAATDLPKSLLSEIKLNAHYNYACCLSRTDKKDDAVKEFKASVELGFFDWEHIKKDDDLDAIRDMDSFKQVVEDGKKLECDRMAKRVASGNSPFKFDFDVSSLDGKKLSPEKLQGKVVVACIFFDGQEGFQSAPALEQLHQAYKDKGVQVLGLGVGRDADAMEEETAKKIVKKTGVTFPVAVTEPTDTMKTALARSCFLVIMDKTGKVRAAAWGGFQLAALEAAVKPLLDEAGGEKKDDKKDEKKEEKKDF
ncbi:MAG TPA: TlpA disulfide reductase family protein [Planctomycetota bacterium]|nr:TlpA disulfide reductase family protein [Planctomycetota bacterium]